MREMRSSGSSRICVGIGFDFDFGGRILNNFRNNFYNFKNIID